VQTFDHLEAKPLKGVNLKSEKEVLDLCWSNNSSYLV